MSYSNFGNSVIPFNTFSAPNGTYGTPSLGICDHLFGSTMTQHVPSGHTVEIHDKYVIHRYESGYNCTVNKETGKVDTWMGW